jgi:deoxyribonuclease (pyrimidine dimer)
MTRLNLVDPKVLTDQHLFAEWREIKMVPKALARSLAARGQEKVLASIPSTYRLGKGHVSFFYNKFRYLEKRYDELTAALLDRKIHDFNLTSQLDPDRVYMLLDSKWKNDYEPDWQAFAAINQRIRNRIRAKPSFYKYYGQPIPRNFYDIHNDR